MGLELTAPWLYVSPVMYSLNPAENTAASRPNLNAQQYSKILKIDFVKTRSQVNLTISAVFKS